MAGALLMKFTRFATALGLAAGLAFPAAAATITLKSPRFSEANPVPHYHYEGPVVAGDLDRLAKILSNTLACDPQSLPAEGGKCAILTLQSEGGNYIEGLRLAEFARDHALATRVQSGAYCYSACAFAFLGGSGYAGSGGVGAYIDRTLDPGGTLGFHAPYYAADELGGLVADIGLEEVLGGNRESIALMIGQLVRWNVDTTVLQKITSMGADEAYIAKFAQDLYLLHVALPQAPVKLWNPNAKDALYNACLRLLARHEEVWPYDVTPRVQQTLLKDIGANEFGQKLSGYQIAANPDGLTVSYCALPSAEAGLDGDADIALYTGAGVSGIMRPVLSFFHRPDGWSSLGTRGNADRGYLQKGTIGHLFMPPGRDLGEGISMIWKILG